MQKYRHLSFIFAKRDKEKLVIHFDTGNLYLKIITVVLYLLCGTKSVNSWGKIYFVKMTEQ